MNELLETLKASIASQYEAALATMSMCVEQCPDDAWDSPVANLAYCQIVFHTLFFTDYYLGTDEQTLRDQPFHRDHAEYFRDYEELQDRKQRLMYDRGTTEAYLAHCRDRARQVVASETADTLSGPSGFAGREFSRAELHVYTIRHLQHHAAQLSLRLRLDHDLAIPWVGHG